MREHSLLKTARIDPPVNGYRRLAICVEKEGVYLLMAKSEGDAEDPRSYDFDALLESVTEAEEDALEAFGVGVNDWKMASTPSDRQDGG